ncbi:MAG TPA: hypothetical protein VGG13_01710 [Candidatus Saccharimonadales bacterium]|jgi:hypothetical protein
MRTLLQRFYAVLNSRRFSKAILAFFVIEAAWIALSAAYPQAFDENFHFGLIKVYSHYWLPFLSHQPPNANAYGAVPRDPSYLYHYTMSFPYRLIALFVHGQTAQVIILRFINIALAATGLVLFRRVLLRARVSLALTNLCLALFVLIPIVPQVAGQVNYDNLLFPLVAWACLLTMRAADELKVRKPSARTLLTLATVCVFMSLVKYEALPIFVGIVLFLAYELGRNFRGRWRQLLPRLWESWQRQSRIAQLVLAALFVISLGFFAERDGVNLVKYHTFTPDCSKVLSVNACSAYSPWYFNYQSHRVVAAHRGSIDFANPIAYTEEWVYLLWYRLFFAINGPVQFTNYPPLPLPAAAGALLGITSIVAVILWRRRIFNHSPYLVLFSVITVIYLLTLWAAGYAQYRHTHVLEMMNGRYLLPILLPIVAIVAKPFSLMLRRFPRLKISLAALALLFFVEGGGVFTFIMRSDNTWDWQNTAVVHVNNAARKTLRPVIIEGSKTYNTSIWMFN